MPTVPWGTKLPPLRTTVLKPPLHTCWQLVRWTGLWRTRVFIFGFTSDSLKILGQVKETLCSSIYSPIKWELSILLITIKYVCWRKCKSNRKLAFTRKSEKICQHLNHLEIATIKVYFLPEFLICIPLLSHTISTSSQDHIMYGKLFLENVILNGQIEDHLMNELYFI